MTFFHQLGYFREGAEQIALDRVAQCDTHLAAWFKLNTENEIAHCYSYVDIPHHFISLYIVNGRLD